MQFSVYGRFQIEVKRERGAWVVYRLGPGTRSRMDDVVIPATLEVSEISTYLDDIFHELSQPGQHIELLE